jgi:hypothetical protein
VPPGRFEARIGVRGPTCKHVYLGLYGTEFDASRAYDRAAVRLKGGQASTNSALLAYAREVVEHDLKAIELSHNVAFQVMLLSADERLASGLRLPLSSAVKVANGSLRGVSEFHSDYSFQGFALL